MSCGCHEALQADTCDGWPCGVAGSPLSQDEEDRGREGGREGLESWAINPGLEGLNQAACVSPAIVLPSEVKIPVLRVILKVRDHPQPSPSPTDSNLILIKCSTPWLQRSLLPGFISTENLEFT